MGHQPVMRRLVRKSHPLESTRPARPTTLSPLLDRSRRERSLVQRTGPKPSRWTGPRRGLGVRAHRSHRLVDLGEDARLICRRERPDPGHSSRCSIIPGASGISASSRTRVAYRPTRRHSSAANAVMPASSPVLERLQTQSRGVRELHPERRLGGCHSRRRGAHHLGSDDLCRRRVNNGRAEDDPLPASPCRRGPSFGAGGGSSCGCTSPCRGLKRSGGPS